MLKKENKIKCARLYCAKTQSRPRPYTKIGGTRDKGRAHPRHKSNLMQLSNQYSAKGPPSHIFICYGNQCVFEPFK